MVKRFYFDAGEHAINAGLNMTGDKVDALNKNKEKFKLRNIMETTDYVVFKYAFNGFVNTGFYSKNSHKSYLINAFWVDDLNKVSIPFPRLSANGYLIGIRDAFEFKQLLNNNKKAADNLKEMAAKLNNSSNPVIVKIKLKPF